MVSELQSLALPLGYGCSERIIAPSEERTNTFRSFSKWPQKEDDLVLIPLEKRENASTSYSDFGFSRYPYFFDCWKMNIVTMIAHPISANTTDAQTPSLPINVGKSMTDPSWNTRVLAKEIIAETIPLLRAVNMLPENMEKPQIK